MDEIPDETPPIEKISQHTAHLLHQIADETVKKIRVLDSRELRNILHHFVAMPFPADDLVTAAEEEIERRQKSSDENSAAAFKLKDLLKKVPADILQQLGEIEKVDSAKAVKKMKRYFARDANRNKNDEAADMTPSETLDGVPTDAAPTDVPPSLDHALEIILAAAGVRDSEVDFPTHKSDRVEYGRIQELISQYRRIDFESGARRSRFNKEGQRLMAKRMMSRLMPQQ